METKVEQEIGKQDEQENKRMKEGMERRRGKCALKQLIQ